MKSALLRVIACAALLAMAAHATPHPESFVALLRQAEAVRSADPSAFSRLLDELDARRDEATPQERLRLRYLKAYQLGYSGRFDLAIEAASSLFEDTDDVDLKVRAGALVVNSRAGTREFTEGLVFLDRTLALLGRVRDPEVRHHGWSAAGVMYNQVGQHDLARHYAELILADGTTGRTRCFAGTLRLESLNFLGQLPEDAAQISRVIDDCLGSGEKMLANFGRLQLAHHLAAQDDVSGAIALLESHLPEIEATRYPRLLGEVHSLLAQLLLARGDRAAADRHALRAIANSAGIAYSMPLVLAHRVLYENAMARGDTAAALDQYRLYAEADRAYLNTVKARELAFQLARHETLQKTKTIEQLDSENRVLQLEQRVASQRARNIQLLVALLVVLLASIGFWAYRTKRTQVAFRRLAETDALTGVSNRHDFGRRAAEALELCRRNGDDVSLVMFDLDRFKAINDQYGHAVGDWVLVQVAAVCRAACRRGDLFGRLGGEEFAFLLVGAGEAAATEMAHVCLKRIRTIETADTGRDFHVSASFGVATATDAGYEFHTLLQRADEAMYRAKRGGRDRVARAADPVG